MMDGGASWEGQGGNDHQSPGAHVHVDFQQYLDLGMPGLDDDGSFGFEDFNAQSHQQNGVSGVGGGMGDGNMGSRNHMAHQQQQKQNIPQAHQMMGQGSQQHQSSPVRQQHLGQQGNNGGRNNSINEIDAQIQYLQMQRQRQQQQQLQEHQQNFYVQQTTRIIPPTPNSMEMHSRDRQQYMQATGHGHGHGHMQEMQQNFMYDGSQQIQMRQHDLAFTPLVSPAVTPLDTHFHIPDYSMPGAFFSPLTSPALHAENGYGNLYAPSHPLSSDCTSPTEMSLDLLPLPASQGGMSRKLSQQNQARNSIGKAPSKSRATRQVRQSPIVKPLNSRRKPTISAISPETLSELIEPALMDSGTPSSHASSHPSDSLNCSPNKDSISPEHLSDMAPPPLPAPRSVKGSPFLLPQNNGSSHPRVQQLIASNSSGAAIPATPASLMKIARKESDSLSSPLLEMQTEENQDSFMEGFSLPEPASESTMMIEDQTTPTVERERSPLALPELPPPAVAQIPLPRSGVIKPSPSMKPQSSGNSSRSAPSLRKTPKLAARGSGSVHASPALLPKISPSIKPQNYQHGQSISDDTAQLLLTTKSNYQNILEGNHLPGVSYPSELSTNLTSKRTSHKLAEQGRRNRINVALQEIATLLPPAKSAGKSGSGADDKQEDGGDSGGNGEKGGPPGGGKGTCAGSKASTVEQAIEYIKKLKEEVQMANRRAEEAERRVKEMGGGEEGTEG